MQPIMNLSSQVPNCHDCHLLLGGLGNLTSIYPAWSDSLDSVSEWVSVSLEWFTRCHLPSLARLWNPIKAVFLCPQCFIHEAVFLDPRVALFVSFCGAERGFSPQVEPQTTAVTSATIHSVNNTINTITDTNTINTVQNVTIKNIMKTKNVIMERGENYPMCKSLQKNRCQNLQRLIKGRGWVTCVYYK